MGSFGRFLKKRRNKSRQRKPNVMRPTLELLEDRLAPAVLPVPLVDNHQDLAAGHSPQVAYDPLNPDNMVVVYASGLNVQGQFSTDGGDNWATFGVSEIIEPTINPPANRFDTVADPSVAFDRDGNFYITFIERDAASVRGAILMNKYDFDGAGTGVPDEIVRLKHLYEWNGLDPARNVFLTVDNVEPTFTDPETFVPFDSAFRYNTVYVAWNVEHTGAGSPVKIIASADGGHTFSTQRFLSDFPASPFPNNTLNHFQGSSPSLAVDAAGNLLAVFNDFQRNSVEFDMIQDGGVGAFFFGTNTSHFFSNDNDQDIVPGPTITTSAINITGVAGAPLADVDVRINLTHDDVSELIVTLIAPDGTRIELVNQEGTAGQSFQNTVFDDEALNPIAADPGPYDGLSFQPEQLLSVLDGLDPTGTWTLEIQDLVPRANSGSFFDWSLDFDFDPLVITNTLLGQNFGPTPTSDFIFVADDSNVVLADVNALINITHPRTREVVARLTSPDATQITLVNQRPNSVDGANFDDTLFDDESATPISSGLPPFSGDFQPEQPLSIFDSLPATGFWRLDVSDVNAIANNGTLNTFELQLQFADVTFDSTGMPQEIGVLPPPTTIITSNIGVGGVFNRIDDINVFVDIEHDDISELDVFLVAPNGQRILLVSQEGTAGQNLRNVTFDDDAADSIISNPGPFDFLVYRPQEYLSALHNIPNPNGIWTLEIHDSNTLVNDGELDFWSMTFRTTSPSSGVVVDATVPASGDHIPQITSFFVDVFIPNGNFTTISDMDVVLNLEHVRADQLDITLIAPDGTIFQLLDNRIGPDGQAITVPAPGTPPGLAPNTAFVAHPNPMSNQPFDVNAGIVFDQDAPRNIVAATSGQRAHFRPEDRIGISQNLDFYVGASPIDVNGVWELQITDFHDHDTNNNNNGFLRNWGVRFTSGLTDGNDQFVGSAGGGAADSPFAANQASPTGIGPGPVIAIDRTLGSFSPYKDRVYVAFAGNADVRLNTADPDPFFGGYSFSGSFVVNDDDFRDNFTEGNRTQYMPSVAVDPVTGTLVLTWFDARFDAANVRTATYIATSIDGGNTFSEQTFLNEPKLARDGITGETIIVEPIPSNPGSTGSVFGFGDRQGLTVYGGEVVSIWAGNDNAAGSTLKTARTRIAAGPRIVASDQGPVVEDFVFNGDFNNPEVIYNDSFLLDGTRQLDAIRVTFDRPINPFTFSPDDVVVLYRSPNTPTNLPGEVIPVAAVIPLNGETLFGPNQVGGNNSLATEFLIRLAAPQFRTGTYSYAIGPEIQDRIRRVATFVTPSGQPQTFFSQDPPVDIPDNDILGASSVITVEPGPGPVIADINVTVNITHSFVSDLVLTLSSPNFVQTVTLAEFVGLDGENFTNTTFDDEALVHIDDFLNLNPPQAPFTGSFRPQEFPFTFTVPPNFLSNFIGLDAAGDWTLQVTDLGGGAEGTIDSWSMQVTYGTPTRTEVLGNFMDQDGDSVNPEDPDDIYANPRPLNGVPFQAPYDNRTLPLIIPGPYVVDTRIPGASDVRQVGSPEVFETGLLGLFGEPTAIPDDGTPQTFGIDQDPATLAWGIDVPNGLGEVLFDVNVTVDIDHTAVGQLVVVLIAPNGQRITLADQVGGNGNDFDNTIFDDAAFLSINDAGANPPYSGTFRPEEPLRDLARIDPVGLWSLEVTDTVTGQFGSVREWALEITYGSEENLALNEPLNAIDVTFDRNIDASTFTPADISSLLGQLGPITGPFTVTANPPGTPAALQNRVFRIGFPQQILSGTYAMRIGSEIRSIRGDLLDNNLNAGLQVLRGVDPNSGAIQNNFFNQPQPSALPPGTTVRSVITINEPFVISQDNLNHIRLALDIQHPEVPDLTAHLIAPDGTVIRLFSGVGTIGAANGPMSNVIFDDFAATPIESGTPPFNGTFNPNVPLSNLIGKNAGGVWQLEITNAGNDPGTLTFWNLTFPQSIPGTGLGEAAADDFTVAMRIFNQDPTQEVNENQWTDIGPNPYANGNVAGSVTAIAVDPADTSGNTVIVGGESGGVWKTSNFLTTDPAGPTWIPLMDFGPTRAFSIGSISIFGRNNDPNQSIVIIGTGAGSAFTTGIGFLRSEDGGQTWQTISQDVDGNSLIGSNFYKIINDPTTTTAGESIFYAALGGNTNGGVYRSLDSGRSWKRISQIGEATDVILVQNAIGIRQILFAGIRGQGIFTTNSATTASSLNLISLTTTLGRVHADGTGEVVTDVSNGSPLDATGRITLAVPYTNGNPLQDTLYEGWIYAAVADPNQIVRGLYVSKNFGKTWTRVFIPTRFSGPSITNGFATNRENQDANLLTRNELDPLWFTGDQWTSLSIDPTNPRIVYLGGVSGVFRIDTTTMDDVYSLVQRDNSDNDGGLTQGATTGPVSGPGTVGLRDPFFILDDRTDVFNMLRDPDYVFVAGSTQRLTGGSNATTPVTFNNTGEDIRWQSFTVSGGSGGQNTSLSYIDPLTGGVRLLFGTEFGIYTAVDRGDGTFVTGPGTATAINGTRNGNLHLVELTSGAGQPSKFAADLDNALFYGISQTDGNFQSEVNILQTGLLDWRASGTTGEWVETSLDGNIDGVADAYRFVGFFNDFFQYHFPGTSPGDGTYFVARTTGLVQDTFSTFSRFALNPADPTAIVISSFNGSIYRTSTLSQGKGVNWVQIGASGDLDGSRAQALAFGAPEENDQGILSNVVYAGTLLGNVHVTTNASDWVNTGPLGGGSVQMIAANPTRDSTDAYAVTFGGVFYNTDVAGSGAWQDITGNLFSLQRSLFRDPNQPAQALQFITSIVADWRFADAGTNTPPILYVAGLGGVFRSLDNGLNWELFPNLPLDEDDGGYLPNVLVTDLNLLAGNINPDNGLHDASGSMNLLMATTEGRGAFVIRLDEAIPPTAGPNSGPIVLSASVPPGTPPSNNQLPAAFDVQFDSLVDPSTFTPADVIIQDPFGNVMPVIQILDNTGIGTQSQFRIEFDPTQTGNYTLTIGPFVTNFSGQFMNQDGDSINGEQGVAPNGDVFQASRFVQVNQPPTISDIGHQITQEGVPTGVITFFVSDPEDSGTTVTVTATSSNETLVPNSPANIGVGGSGNSRSIQIFPVAGEVGVTTITVTVTDSGGSTATDTFELLVQDTVTLTFMDDFNRADTEVFLGAGFNQIGNWSRTDGAGVATSANSFALLNGVNEQHVSVQTDYGVSNAVNGFTGVLARFVDNLNYYEAGVLNTGNGFLAQIRRVVNGQTTVLRSQPIPFGAGRIRLEVFGVSLRLFVDEQFQMVAYDDQLLTTGTVGVRASLSGSIDNFIASSLPVNIAGLPFSDNFNQPEMFLSRFWQDRAGDLRVEGVKVTSFGTGPSLATLNGFTAADARIEVDYTVSPTGNHAVGLVARQTGNLGTNFYRALIRGSGGNLTAEIWRNVNGVETLLASAPAPFATGRLRFEVQGNVLRLFVANNLIVSATDSSLVAAGRVGIWSSGVGGMMDNFFINQVATTSALVQSSSTSIFGEQVTFTVTVSAASGTATGHVDFFSGSNFIDSAPLVNNGGMQEAEIFVSSLSVTGSPHSITGVYVPDNLNFGPSTSNAVTHTVSQGATTTSLVNEDGDEMTEFGVPVTFTATVAPVAPSTAPPTGMVNFLDDGISIGSVALDGSGEASLIISTLSVGSYPNITAMYVGNADYAVSNSNPVNHDVVAAMTTSSVVSYINPTVYGQEATFIATIITNSSALIPTGTVEFFVDNVSVGTDTVNTLGNAYLAVNEIVLGSHLTLGAHTVRVEFSNGGNFGSSVSPDITHNVNPAPTVTIVSSSQNPSAPGDNVTFTVTVSASPSQAIPTGDVEFLLDGVSQGTFALNGSGQASFVGQDLDVGTHTVKAIYTSDAAEFNSSQSGLFKQLVKKEYYAVGAEAGGGPRVKVYDAQNNQLKFDFFAFSPTFTGGVRVATGDVTGDGVPDIIVAAGPGGGPHVKVFDGNNLALIREVFAFSPTFTGGLFVASGDLNNDGFADIVISADAGGGPHVKWFDGRTGTEQATFFAYDPSFSGGVRIAVGDINGDDFADIVTTAGPGGGPHITAFSGKNVGTILANFMAFDPSVTIGIYVAVGDITGNGKHDIITGAGAGGGPHITAFNSSGQQLASFFAYEPTFSGGIRVAAVDRNLDGHADIIAGAGPTGGPRITIFDGLSHSVIDDFFAFEPSFPHGVYVAGG